MNWTRAVAWSCLFFLPLSILPDAASAADKPYITLASTTSTQNSGLFDHILPLFSAKTGIAVRVVAVGTGAALRLARNGDADVLLVHHRPSEDAFVDEGFGVKRHPLMHNDFVLVGPQADPAGIVGGRDAGQAFKRIAETRAPFVSRGDDSGTHKRELEIWRRAAVDTTAHSGTWYRETGSGMGAALNTASAMSAYTLSDRGTWLGFRNKRQLAVLVEGEAGLINSYGVVVVAAEHHPHVKQALGQRFVDWLLSAAGRDAIAGHRIDGQQLFFPD